MKRTFFQSAILASVLIFSACSKEEREPRVKPKPVQQQQAVISVTPTDIEVAAEGNENVEILVSGGEVTAKIDDVNWVSAEKTDKGFIVRVQPNKTGQKRIGAIHFLHQEKEVAKTLITQASMPVLPLPLYDFGKTVKDITDAEKGRSEISFVREDSQGEGSTLIYKINDNPHLTDLYYVVTLNGYERSKISLNKSNSEAKSVVEAYLLQEGYEKIIAKGFKTTLSITPEDKEMFLHKKHQVIAEYYEDAKDPHFAFKYEAVQQKAFPSFDRVPVIIKGVELADKEVEEASKKSELVKDNVLTANYKDNKGKNRRKEMYKVTEGGDLLYRQHFFLENDKNKKYLLTQTTFYYTNFNLAFFAGLDGKYYLTEEFKTLMEQNNFKPVSNLTIAGSKYAFTKGEGSNKINILVIREKPADGFEPLLKVQVY